jgi:hypothetical protein
MHHRPVRIQLRVTQQEKIALDDYQFSHRIPTKTEALRQVLRRGLNAQTLKDIEEKRNAGPFRRSDATRAR